MTDPAVARAADGRLIGTQSRALAVHVDARFLRPRNQLMKPQEICKQHLINASRWPFAESSAVYFSEALPG